MKSDRQNGFVAMKNFVLVFVFGVLLVCGCDIAGGISRRDVESELSRYIDGDTAHLIVKESLCVDTNALVRISFENLSSDAMTLVLLHPSFPQWRRSELIAAGRDGFYLDNACLSDTLTDEDVHHWVNRSSVSESVLESALKSKNLSDESKDKIKQRIRKTLSYRMRLLFGTGQERE